jgi:hypothetical protein
VSRTLAQKTNIDGFPKPGELIEITGAHALEASDRAVLNTLYQYAHDTGRLGKSDAEWEIPLARLRQSRHESNDRLDACLDRLMRVIVNVPYTAEDGEPRILKTHLFDFFDLSIEHLRSRTNATQPPTEQRQRHFVVHSTGIPRAIVRFGIPKKLQPLLAQSNRWGRIKAEVICAMTSKYAIALYELVQLRANMDRCIETFPIDRFRDLLGVPPDAYVRGNDFVRNVIEPAMLEVNGLSDTRIDVEPKRRSKFTPIEAVTVVWWRKQGDDFRAAMQERNRSKVGRMARLRGEVEKVTALRPI